MQLCPSPEIRHTRLTDQDSSRPLFECKLSPCAGLALWGRLEHKATTNKPGWLPRLVPLQVKLFVLGVLDVVVREEGLDLEEGVDVVGRDQGEKERNDGHEVAVSKVHVDHGHDGLHHLHAKQGEEKPVQVEGILFIEIREQKQGDDDGVPDQGEGSKLREPCCVEAPWVAKALLGGDHVGTDAPCASDMTLAVGDKVGEGVHTNLGGGPRGKRDVEAVVILEKVLVIVAVLIRRECAELSKEAVLHLILIQGLLERISAIQHRRPQCDCREIISSRGSILDMQVSIMEVGQPLPASAPERVRARCSHTLGYGDAVQHGMFKRAQGRI